MTAPRLNSVDQTPLQRRSATLNRLLEVSLVLNTSLSLKPMLTHIMEAVCEITEAEAASILLYNRNTDELRFVASNSPGADVDELLRIPVPMEGSIAGQIVRERRAILIQDAETDPRIFRSVDKSIGFVTRSILGVPMHVKGSVVGVLEALNKRSGPWVEDDLHNLTILASHAAVAITNARQTEAIRKAYEELDKLDKIKSEFIAIASHELRTPLGVILGYASFLKEEAQGEASEHAAAVMNSALQLRSLIEEMTNLRYLHTGESELSREDTPLSALLLAAHNDVQATANAREQSLDIDLKGADAVVHVDRGKIGMALCNVLNNAVRFTPVHGEIRLSVERRAHEVWVRVADNGIGIPADQLEPIFQEFYQVADHMTREHNGMGLGLAIARGVVEAHGGRLWAESAGPGQGATFTMALPANPHSPGPSLPQGERGEKRDVL